MFELFKAPTFSDPEKTRQAQALHAIAIAGMIIVTAFALLFFLALPHRAVRWWGPMLSIYAVSSTALVMSRRGHVRAGSLSLLTVIGVIVLVLSLSAGGVRSPAILGGFIVIVLYAAVLLGQRASLIAGAVLTMAGFGLVYLESAELLPQRVVFLTPMASLAITVMYLIYAYVAMRLATRSITTALEQARAVLAERTRAEQAFRESEARYRTLSEASFEGIAISENGVIVDCNEQLVRMHGMTRETLIGKALVELVAPQSRDVVRRAILTGAEGPHEHLGIRADGSLLPTEVRAKRMTFGGRQVRVSIVRDMTAIKQAEAALQESVERLRSLGDNLPDGAVFQLLQESNGSLRFLYVSAGIERIMGIKPEALLQDYSLLYATMTPEDRKITQAKRAESLRNLTPFETDARLQRANGETHWVHTRSAPRCLPDGRVVWDGFVTDITVRKRAEAERERLEAQLRQSHKMQALGTLAGGVAHDFNNLLTAIKGNAALAQEDLPPTHPAQQSLAEIAKASARAADIVNRILAFSRQQEAARKVTLLRPIVEEALGLLRSALPRTIEMHVHFGDSVPPVAVDATQIVQVIMNLGTNAEHAMNSHGGVLRIGMEVVTTDAKLVLAVGDLQEGRRYVHLSVSDTGHGMDSDTLQRIFEPFFTTGTGGHGTGLGLAMVHGIVKDHGGAIAVESALGKGTTFHIYLPAADAITSAHAASDAAIEPGGGQHVLFVDDEEAIVDIAVSMLERAGYRVSGMSDARQALQAFAAQPDAYEAVITDMTMPGMTGPQLVRELRTIRPQVPIVMMSGHLQSRQSESIAGLNIYELLQKPDAIFQLAGVLQRVFADKQANARSMV